MKEFQGFLEEESARLKQEDALLREEERRDEANLVRVRRNIFEVCGTIWKVVQRTAEPDEQVMVYLHKLDNLPLNWKEALEQAKAHDDAQRVMIEEIKLQTLAKIRERFCGEAEQE